MKTETMIKHTPAPWAVQRAGTACVVFDKNRNVVAECPRSGAGIVTEETPAPWHSAKENAQLIATSPELLATLLELISLVETLRSDRTSLESGDGSDELTKVRRENFYLSEIHKSGEQIDSWLEKARLVCEKATAQI